MVEPPPFEALLRAAVEASDHRPVLLPVIGLALRVQDPSFDARRYGADKLKLLLASRPDLGRLIEIPGKGDAWEPAETTSTLNSAPAVRLRRELWRALTAPEEDADAWRFDLDRLALVRVQGEVADGLQQTPERFLSLPRPTDELELAWRRAFLSEVVQWPGAEASELEDWTVFRECVHELHRWRDWLDYRRGRIAAHALAWAKRHGIRACRITSPLVHSAAPSPAHAPAAGRRSGHLRRLVHRAIDLMDDEALAALPIPAGVMARAAAELPGGRGAPPSTGR